MLNKCLKLLRKHLIWLSRFIWRGVWVSALMRSHLWYGCHSLANLTLSCQGEMSFLLKPESSHTPLGKLALSSGVNVMLGCFCWACSSAGYRATEHENHPYCPGHDDKHSNSFVKTLNGMTGNILRNTEGK